MKKNFNKKAKKIEKYEEISQRKKIESFIESIVKDHLKLKVRFGSMLVLFSILIIVNYIYIIISKNYDNFKLTGKDQINLIYLYLKNISVLFQQIYNRDFLAIFLSNLVYVVICITGLISVICFVMWLFNIHYILQYNKKGFFYCIVILSYCLNFGNESVFIFNSYLLLFFLLLLFDFFKIVFNYILNFKYAASFKINKKTCILFIIIISVSLYNLFYLSIFMIIFNMFFLFFFFYCYFYEIFIVTIALFLKFILNELLFLAVQENNYTAIYNEKYQKYIEILRLLKEEYIKIALVFMVVFILCITGILIKKIKVNIFFNFLNIITVTLVTTSYFSFIFLDFKNFTTVILFLIFVFLSYMFIFIEHINKNFKEENIDTKSIFKNYIIMLFTYMLYISVLKFWNDIFINLFLFIEEINHLINAGMFNLFAFIIPFLLVFGVILLSEYCKKIKNKLK